MLIFCVRNACMCPVRCVSACVLCVCVWRVQSLACAWLAVWAVAPRARARAPPARVGVAARRPRLQRVPRVAVGKILWQ